MEKPKETQVQQVQEQQAPPVNGSADRAEAQTSHESSNPSKSSSSNQSDSSPNHKSNQKPQSKRNFLGATAASWRLPKINLSKIKIPKINLKQTASGKPRNWLLLWLLIIMVSYVCMGYFLSVLMTIPNRQMLAIAGFAIVGILPIITAFADYGLMKWGYLLSGLLVVGAFIFWLRMRFYLTVLAVIIWIGITMVAFVGEYLLKQKRKFVVAIAMITVPCLVGLGIGWQLWNLAANHLS